MCYVGGVERRGKVLSAETLAGASAARLLRALKSRGEVPGADIC